MAIRLPQCLSQRPLINDQLSRCAWKDRFLTWRRLHQAFFRLELSPWPSTQYERVEAVLRDYSTSNRLDDWRTDDRGTFTKKEQLLSELLPYEEKLFPATVRSEQNTIPAGNSYYLPDISFHFFDPVCTCKVRYSDFKTLRKLTKKKEHNSRELLFTFRTNSYSAVIMKTGALTSEQNYAERSDSL